MKSSGMLNSPTKLAEGKSVSDMAIFQKFNQSRSHPCRGSRCSHLCFSVPSSGASRSQRLYEPEATEAQCGCPTHYYLAPDNVTCLVSSTYQNFICRPHFSDQQIAYNMY